MVSIIIINYNSSAFTQKCVDSIFLHSKGSVPFELIIVDNASLSSDWDTLVSLIPECQQIKLVRSKINLGFSGGNMLGVQHAKGEYLFFLNNDCELLNDNLQIYVNFLTQNPSVGACTGQMFNTDLTFHHSFNYFPEPSVKLFSSGIMRVIDSKKYPSKRIHYENPLKVPSITGAAMFVRKEAFSAIGGFDPSYFLYCEEEDLCYRMQKKGYDIYVVPEARFVHHMGKSTVQSYAVAREYYISLFHFYRKNYHPIAIWLLRFLLIFKHLRKSVFKRDQLKIAYFILRGCPAGYSLRFQQTIA